MDETVALNKRPCGNYERGCRVQLNLNFPTVKCPECLGENRIKEREAANVHREKPKVEEVTGNILCSTCFKYHPSDHYIGEKTETVARCKGCRENGKRADQNRDREHRRLMERECSKKTERRIIRYQKDAREQKLSFELSYEQFCEMTQQVCYYCGIIQEEGFNGIERKIRNIGFTVDNTVPCCTMCNDLKHALSEDVFLKSVEHISTYSGKIQGQLFPDAFRSQGGSPLCIYVNRAKDKGFPCDLTVSNFPPYLKNPCYLCGKLGSNVHNNGIDRVDNNIGYTIDNMKSCCGQCNWMKGVYNLETFLNKLVSIYRYRNSKPSV